LKKARNPAARENSQGCVWAFDFPLSVFSHAVYFAGWFEFAVRLYNFGVL
jgi:hypothetical protein